MKISKITIIILCLASFIYFLCENIQRENEIKKIRLDVYKVKLKIDRIYTAIYCLKDKDFQIYHNATSTHDISMTGNNCEYFFETRFKEQ